MPGNLLTDDELAELTGVEQAAAQLRVLREHGLHPIVRRDGKPRITWASVDAFIIGNQARNEEPDWSALQRRA